MEQRDISTISHHLSVIARVLAYRSLNEPPIRDATQGVQAVLLKSFGMENKEIADLLGTTPGTVAVRATEEKRKRGSKRNGKRRAAVSADGASAGSAK